MRETNYILCKYLINIEKIQLKKRGGELVMSDLTIPLKVVDNGDGTYSTTSVINAAIPAGGNLIGKVGIDQATDGTTNRVVSKISQTDDENVVSFGNTAQPVFISGSSINVSNVATVTTAGTRVQLPDIPCREITIIAKRLNTGYIFVGGSNISSTVYGVELAAKESFTFAVANANLIYIDASVSGEGISYVAI